MKSNNGMYNYFGKEIYKQFVNNQFMFDDKPENFENTIFFQAMDFLKSMDEKKNLVAHPLLNEYINENHS